MCHRRSRQTNNDADKRWLALWTKKTLNTFLEKFFCAKQSEKGKRWQIFGFENQNKMIY